MVQPAAVQRAKDFVVESVAAHPALVLLLLLLVPICLSGNTHFCISLNGQKEWVSFAMHEAKGAGLPHFSRFRVSALAAHDSARAGDPPADAPPAAECVPDSAGVICLENCGAFLVWIVVFCWLTL